MDLDGKVIIIPGANGGLGRAVTPAFLQAGARVATVDRQVQPKPVEGQFAFSADVTDEADVRRVIGEIIEKMGRVDGLINLVGGFALAKAVETAGSLWQRMLSMNVTSAFLLSRAVLPHMVERGSGRIVHIAARTALDPFAGAAAYLVSKSALIALIRTLAVEHSGSGVTINGLLPTTIDTTANRKNMPDADPSKWVKPESIAQLLVFLASDEASAVNGALIPLGAN